jgi:hypothetical protein
MPSLVFTVISLFLFLDHTLLGEVVEPQGEHVGEEVVVLCRQGPQHLVDEVLIVKSPAERTNFNLELADAGVVPQEVEGHVGEVASEAHLVPHDREDVEVSRVGQDALFEESVDILRLVAEDLQAEDVRQVSPGFRGWDLLLSHDLLDFLGDAQHVALGRDLGFESGEVLVHVPVEVREQALAKGGHECTHHMGRLILSLLLPEVTLHEGIILMQFI